MEHLHPVLNSIILCFFVCIVAGCNIFPAQREENQQPNAPLTVFNDNGAWCWYQDPRVLVDPVNNTMLISSIAGAEGPDGQTRAGDVDVVTYHLSTGKTDRFVLRHALRPVDDHNAAALLIRPDGRYLAMYTRHNQDAFSYWRISTRPHDATDWQPEQTFDWTQYLAAVDPTNHVTYSNLFYLSSENRTYDFSRALNCDPSILISADHGDHWTYGGKLLTEPRVGYVNGYTKYASNGVDRIDFLTTNHHPRDFNNSIFHGFIQNGQLHRSDGTVINDNVLSGNAPSQTKLTTVFAANSVYDGQIMTHAWTICVHIDRDGRPYGLISTRAGDVPENTNFSDHRAFYVRYDGSAWQVHPLAKLGACLWPAEEDYTGLSDVDPGDPNIVYVSTPIDPRDGSVRKCHEIFKGVTRDGGCHWQWSAITHDSPMDNLRPVCVSCGAGQSAVLWFRGTMSRSQHFNSAIVGTFIGNTTD